MKHFYFKPSLIIVVMFLQWHCFSQAPAIQWQKTLGGSSVDYAFCTFQTTDGGYILSGRTFSNNGDVTGNHGGADAWVVKLNNFGVIQWQKTLGGASYDEAYSIQQTVDGGYIVVGSTESNDGDITGNHGSADAWVIKLNNTGTIEWQKTLGGTSYDYAYSIQQTIDGSYIIAGETSSTNGDVLGSYGGRDAWVVKLNSTGDLIWQKTLGGTSYDSAQSIQQTAEGDYIVAGYTESTNGDVTGNHGTRDAWVVKLNGIGILQWQKTLGGTSYESAQSIQQTTDGGYIIAGTTGSSDGNVTGFYGGAYDAWVIKLNSNGILQWQKTLGGTSLEIGQSIQQTIDGGFIIAGYTESANGVFTENHGSGDAWVIKLNNIGNLEWQKTLGGVTYDGAQSIKQTLDGGYIMTGYTSTIGNHMDDHFWIVKLATDSLATNNYELKVFSLAPNPTNSQLNLQFSSATPIDKVIVTDLTGKTVLQKDQPKYERPTGEANSNQINVEHLTKGIYILEVFSGDKKWQSKFIKE